MGERQHDKIDRRRQYRRDRFHAASTPEERLTVALDSLRSELRQIAASDSGKAGRERDRIATMLMNVAAGLDTCGCWSCRREHRRSA